MQDPKPFWQSKTFWVNALALVGLAIPQSAAFIAEHLGASGAVWAVVNMVLRVVSKDKISLS